MSSSEGPGDGDAPPGLELTERLIAEGEANLAWPPELERRLARLERLEERHTAMAAELARDLERQAIAGESQTARADDIARGLLDLNGNYPT